MRATYVGAGVSSIPCGITPSLLQRNDGRWASVQNCKRFGEIDVYATRQHQETLPTDDPKGERHDVGSFGTDAMAFHAHLGTARSAVMRALKSEFDALGPQMRAPIAVVAGVCAKAGIPTRQGDKECAYRRNRSRACNVSHDQAQGRRRSLCCQWLGGLLGAGRVQCASARMRLRSSKKAL